MHVTLRLTASSASFVLPASNKLDRFGMPWARRSPDKKWLRLTRRQRQRQVINNGQSSGGRGSRWHSLTIWYQVNVGVRYTVELVNILLVMRKKYDIFGNMHDIIWPQLQ